MRQTRKPVRNCHSCLLNLGDYCWLYRYPRGQWRGDRRCPAFENEHIYAQFRAWQKEPSVKTRKDLRREFFRTRRRTELYREMDKSERRNRARRRQRRGNR
jgi:hypothetical protein